MIKLFTIGFTNKSAEKFFGLLTKNGVRKVIDTRLNNVSQLAGFSKGSDLQFFLSQIGDINYEHRIDLAPTKELLSGYRAKEMTWANYEEQYLKLLKTRDIAGKMVFEGLDKSCLLCSEHEPDKCHRRLLAEYLQSLRNDIEIVHLK
ncbi:MAG: DUF488 domain-containing protein [Ignavibacteriales bacterium]|nr:DUF488 domain-containing protein [Ignavibacteriales bacterium]